VTAAPATAAAARATTESAASSSSQPAASRRRNCFRCQESLTNPNGLNSNKHNYCSDECRYPVCSGRAANGKACRKRRAQTGAYKNDPPRFDQEPIWFCKDCFRKGDNHRKYATTK
jgi:hypothetical protein